MKCSPYFIASACLILSFNILISFTPVLSSEKSSRTLSDIEISKLTDRALQDPIFELITQADIKMILNDINSASPITKQKWDNLAKKRNFSNEETVHILSNFGFTTIKDFERYIGLLTSLGKAYGIDKMNENDQKSFFNSLRKKQRDHIIDNKLIEKGLTNYASQDAGGMPSECWKCVYDLRDCLAGRGFPALTYSTYTTTAPTVLHIDMNQGSATIVQMTYTSLYGPTIGYINTAYTPQQCNDWFRGCVSSCRNN